MGVGDGVTGGEEASETSAQRAIQCVIRRGHRTLGQV